MRQTLLLFDVDGTLITTPAGRQAFSRAFQDVFGLPDAAAQVPMAGRTDLVIFRELCEHYGLPPDRFPAWKRRFLAHLKEALAADPGAVLPGVRPLLEALGQEPGFALALGTGNMEEGARLKLEPHGLNRFFATGGFGEDGDCRDHVIARGIARARERFGRSFDRVIVVGDTPLDIRCGQANGCGTLAVATGRYSLAELRAHSPDHAVADLTDIDRVVQLLRVL